MTDKDLRSEYAIGQQLKVKPRVKKPKKFDHSALEPLDLRDEEDKLGDINDPTTWELL